MLFPLRACSSSGCRYARMSQQPTWPRSADGFARPSPAASAAAAAPPIVAEAIASARVVIFAKTDCPFCKEIISMFSAPPYSTIAYTIVQLDRRPRAECEEILDHLLALTGARSVPRVFVAGRFLGGCDQTKAAHRSGKLSRLLVADDVGTDTPAPAGQILRKTRPTALLLLVAALGLWLWRRVRAIRRVR